MEDVKNESKTRKPWQFQPGNPGGPGRPKGTTLKEFARKWFELKTEEEKIAYIENLEEKRPGFAWNMAEGMPHQTTDIEVGIKPEPIAKLDGVQRDHSLPEDSQAQ